MYRKILLSAAVLAVVGTMTLNAGKNTEPAQSPVIPVTTIPFYIGIGGIMAPTSTNCPCADERKYDTYNFGGILRVGYDFNPYFGIEARFLRSGISKKFATMTHYGIYAKPQVHISDAVNIYGLVGYGHTKVDMDCKANKSLNYEGNGWSFGGGIEYDFAAGDGQGDAEEGWGAFVDYQNILRDASKNAVRSNVVSAGITYDF
jgi:OOP family OmpA-OmpF porin